MNGFDGRDGIGREGAPKGRLSFALFLLVIQLWARRASRLFGRRTVVVAPRHVRRPGFGTLTALGLRLLILSLVPSALLVREAAEASSTPQTKPPDPNSDPSAFSHAQRSQEQWQAWHRSPRAHAAREASKTLYANQTAQQALAIDRKAFPGLDAPGFRSLGSGSHTEKIAHKLSANAALVKDSRGRSSLAESILPLEGTTPDGKSAPLDLDLLSEHGSFVPSSGLVPVSIPRASDGEVAFRDGRFGVRFGAGGPVDGVQTGGSVLYPNIGGASAATDAVVRAVPGGADVSYVLRSELSPQSKTLSFELPAGFSLRGHSGGVEIVSTSGHVIAGVLPPIAVDAQGQTVPASYRIKGQTQLLLTVSHHSGDYAYPIQVDPVLLDYSGAAVYGDWPNGSSNPSDFSAFDISDSGWKMHSGTYYNAGEYAEYYYTAPPGAYVYALTESGVNHSADMSLEYGGIYQYNYAGWEPGVWSQQGGSSGSGADFYYGASAQNATFAYCARAGCPFGPSSGIQSGSTQGNFAIFGLQEWTAGTQGTGEASDSESDATAYLSDSVVPTLTSPVAHSGYTPGTWVSDVGGDIGDNVTVSSSVPNGLGIGHTTMGGQLPSADWQTAYNTCPNNPATPMTAPCNMSQTAQFSYDTRSLPEGITWAQVAATTAGGTSSDGSSNGALWPIQIDRTPPAISLSGGLYNAANADIGDGTFSLNVTASDSSSSIATSGVKQLQITMDNQVEVTQPGQHDCSSGQGAGCSVSAGWTVNPEDYGSGKHTIVVTASDWAGNNSSQQFTVTFHHSAGTRVGPGTVNLRSGELTLQPTDVSLQSFGAPLALMRTYNSRRLTAGASSPFGAPWTSSLPVGQAGGDFASVTVNPDNSVVLSDKGGDTAYFTPGGGSSFSSPEGFEDVTLTSGSGQACPNFPSEPFYKLTDAAGDVTTFMQPSGSAPSAPYVSACETQPGSQNQVTYSFNGQGQPTTAIAPAPAGVTCTPTSLSSPGCRSLSFSYATESAFTTQSDCPSNSGWGDYPGRLTAVQFTGYDPVQKGMMTENVARYCYDSSGLLRAEYDPRISPALYTTYSYGAGGLLTQETPPGLAAWSFNYGTIPGDGNAGRLLSITRPDPANGTATWTIDYSVPTSGAGAPYAMGQSDVVKWGQSDSPVTATAVFPPDEVPSSSPPSDYSRATIHYLDSREREVNVAEPGGRIATTEYDTSNSIYSAPAAPHDLTTRELSPANRAEALAAGCASLPNNCASATTAKLLDTQYSYASNAVDQTERLGPQHQVQLGNGSQLPARQETDTTYGDTSLPAAHLPTQVTTWAQGTGLSGKPDSRTITTVYDDTVGKPTKVTTDSGGLNITQTKAYDDGTGNVIKAIQPASSSGGDAHETDTTYFSAAPNVTYSNCGGHPEWANLPCQSQPAAQPGTTGQPDLPVKTYTYSVWDDPAVTTDTSGGQTRTTTNAYDPAGRPSGKSVTATTGDAVQSVTYAYDPNTGLQTSQTSSDGKTLTAVYDSVGRLTSYTDADGNTSTHTYDIDGRLKTLNDGKGSQTSTYDSTTGDLTSLQDSAAGTFTAAYNTAGQMTSEVYPNGLTANFGYNENGAPTQLKYVQGSSTWFSDQATPSIHDQWLHESNTIGSRSYNYDGAGRLTQAQDTPNTTYPAGEQEQYSVPTSAAQPTGIATGGDGNLWFTEWYGNKIAKLTPTGQITEYAIPTANAYPKEITPGPSGAPGTMWFTEVGSGKIGEINTATGKITEYSASTNPVTTTTPVGITTGPDGALWFTGHNTLGGVIGRITTTGVVTQFPITGTGTASPIAITSGPDGALWFTDQASGKIGRVTTTGTVTEYALPDSAGTPLLDSITSGPDGALWFTDSSTQSASIGRITTAGQVTEYPTGTSGGSTMGITTGPNGALWFVDSGAGKLGQITTSGTISEYPVRSGSLGGGYITTGPDHALWLTDEGGNDILRATDTKHCTVRSYAYDADANRTNQTTIPYKQWSNACDTNTADGTATSHSYDAADRLTDSSVTYDQWGNTLTLPAQDAGGASLTSTYYVSNQLHTQAQNGQTITYNLDPAWRVRERIRSGGSSSDSIDHYTDSGDSPAWTDTGNGNWTRNVAGIDGDLAAIQQSSGTITIQLTNLHGDVIGTAPNNNTGTPTLSQNGDEFGVPYQGAAPNRYDYLGGNRRTTALPTGIIDMGAREYVPALGRFEQTDPVSGGSANSYDYANQDPVNDVDLSGTTPRMFVFTKHQTQFNSADGALTVRVTWHGSGASTSAYLAWGFNAPQAWYDKGIPTTDVTESATLWLNGRQEYNYEDHHVEPLDYPFHSSKAGLRSKGWHQLAINFSWEYYHPQNDTYYWVIEYVRFNFRLKY